MHLYEHHPSDARVTGPKEVCPSIISRFGTGGGNLPLVLSKASLRTITPDECEVLQGFERRHTDRLHRGALRGRSGSNVGKIQGCRQVDVRRGEEVDRREGPAMQIVFQELSDTITAGFAKHHGASGGKDSLPRMHVASQEGVRHLTIVECEILQGFPADYTKVDYLGRTADFCPSDPRY